MVVDQQPIAGYANGEQFGAITIRDKVAERVWCGDDIKRSLYALDVLFPLIDLRQESKCEIGLARDVKSPSASAINAYRHIKALYALIGWLLISLAILAFSSVLERRDARD